MNSLHLFNFPLIYLIFELDFAIEYFILFAYLTTFGVLWFVSNVVSFVPDYFNLLKSIPNFAYVIIVKPCCFFDFDLCYLFISFEKDY